MEDTCQVSPSTCLCALVPSVYEELKQLFPEDEQSDDLLQYFETTYIQGMNLRGHPREAKFPISLWNQYCAASLGEPRTTNSCEGFNHSFQSLLYGDHPSIWKLMEAIRKDIAIQKKTLLDESTGQRATKRRKYHSLNKRVQGTVEKYYNYSDKMKYLRHIVLLQGGTEATSPPIED